MHAEKRDGIIVLQGHKQHGNLAQPFKHVRAQHDDVLVGKKVVRGRHRGFPDQQQASEKPLRAILDFFNGHDVSTAFG